MKDHTTGTGTGTGKDSTDKLPEQTKPDNAELTREDFQQALDRLEKFATWMDAQYRIPGTSITFGWDTIIGLVPVLGDLVTLIMSGAMIGEARRLGAPAGLRWKMVLNIVIDFVGGLLPIVGDVFDIYYRSSTRNLKLLKDYLLIRITPPTESKRTPWLLLSLILAAAVLMVLYLLSTPSTN
nr:DUF4112 domain-containing protein [Hahella sp. CCB-MM4]